MSHIVSFHVYSQPDRIMQFGAVNREYEGRRRDIPYRPGVGLDALGTNSSPRPCQEMPEAGTEERGPPGRPRVAFPSPPMDYTNILGQLTGAGGPRLEMGAGARLGAGMGVPGGAPLNEDFHRSLSSTLGEIVAPRYSETRWGNKSQSLLGQLLLCFLNVYTKIVCVCCFFQNC